MNRSPHSRRVAGMRPRWLRNFLYWWSDAPIYQSILFVPFVMMVFIIAVIKNKFFKQENKNK